LLRARGNHEAWNYNPIVPDVLRTTQLPLPPKTASNNLKLTNTITAFAGTPHDGRYWAAKMQGLNFTSSDHVDAARFNRILSAGLKSDNVPYPTVRSGLDLRKNRRRVLAKAAEEQAKRKQATGQTAVVHESLGAVAQSSLKRSSN
jgi:hypothetical protein